MGTQITLQMVSIADPDREEEAGPGRGREQHTEGEAAETEPNYTCSDRTARQVKLNLGGSVHDPTDPVGRLLFNVLAMVAEFEADLARMRTREGMKVAKAKGWLRGKQPKLSAKQEAHLVALYQAGEHTIGELEELFSITRSTVYRTIARDRVRMAPLTIGATISAPAERAGQDAR
jgi:hypothetical protein